jgi:hypothetical protein
MYLSGIHFEITSDRARFVDIAQARSYIHPGQSGLRYLIASLPL